MYESLSKWQIAAVWKFRTSSNREDPFVYLPPQTISSWPIYIIAAIETALNDKMKILS